MTKIVCVCVTKLVCERLHMTQIACATKLWCDKDCVWKIVCGKVVCERLRVTKLCDKHALDKVGV